MVKISGLAARGEAGFSGFLLAAISWIAAEVLEGCAAYAEAMYPIPLEPPGQFDPADRQNIEDSNQAKIVVIRGDRRA